MSNGHHFFHTCSCVAESIQVFTTVIIFWNQNIFLFIVLLTQKISNRDLCTINHVNPNVTVQNNANIITMYVHVAMFFYESEIIYFFFRCEATEYYFLESEYFFVHSPFKFNGWSLILECKPKCYSPK
jgi:hypothetical protein